MEKISVGLIGYGFSGSIFHAPLLKVLEQFEIAKVLSSNKEKVLHDLGPVKVVTELMEVLDDAKIELVIITSPSGLHYEMAKQSLLAGKHVILEKPMVVEVHEAEELIKIAEEKCLLLSVYHNRRWDNDYLTVKKLVEDGVLGEINTYQVHFDRFRPVVGERWREQRLPGSGVLYDLGSHLIDQALQLFGSPEFVWADVFPQRDKAVTDDYFHVVLGYKNLRVILHSGSVVPFNGPRFQVHGSKGSFFKYGIDSQEAALKEGRLPLDDTWGSDDPQLFGNLVTFEGEEEKHETIPTVNGSYLRYYQEIYSCMREGKNSPVTGYEGMEVIKIIHAAQKSSNEKRAIYLD